MDTNEACGIDFEKYKTAACKKQENKQRPTNCECCVYYDYDEDSDSMTCEMDLDEDEQVRFLSKSNAHCPYFRFYDEYKSVQKQN